MADQPATVVTTGKVRFSYVHVFEPHAFEGQEKKQYSVSILIPKDDKATLAKIRAAIGAAKESGKSKWNNKIPSKMFDPLRDGDEEDKGPEYEGHFFINAKSNNAPGIVDRNRNAILDKTDFYSGCYGRANITFFPFASAGNNGIGCALNHVQKLADGEPLGGGVRVEDAFDDEIEDEDFL